MTTKDFKVTGPGIANQEVRSQIVYVIPLDPVTGQPVSSAAPASGRAAASASAPVALSTEDKASLDKAAGVYRRSAALGSSGDGVLITATTAGTVTLTLIGGGSVVVSVAVGTTILPFAASAITPGTATGATAVALFFA